MIEIRKDRLFVSFPEVHPKANGYIEFQRTLRIPDDNKEYPLPAGLGRFPLSHIDDYKDTVPNLWVKHGGVFIPMHQAEAMWMNFAGDYPMAVKVAAGKINAVTGKQWCDSLSYDPQDYVVLSKQPWIDGFNISSDKVRQFVAMPLGDRYTAEEQITGLDEHGGLQIVVYPMKAEVYNKIKSQSFEIDCYKSIYVNELRSDNFEMGLAPGGILKQKIYKDKFGKDAWESDIKSRCFVHIVNSKQYKAVTSEQPPATPVTSKEYINAGFPWFDLYDEGELILQGGEDLAELDGVGSTAIKLSEEKIDDNSSINVEEVTKLGGKKSQVREGIF